jgi:hypothetical protein
MNDDRVARSRAAVESHPHGETVNEVETALATVADDIVRDAPALNGRGD